MLLKAEIHEIESNILQNLYCSDVSSTFRSPSHQSSIIKNALNDFSFAILFLQNNY